MRTVNTFGIQFIIRLNKSKAGLAPLYCRVTINTQRVEISLKKFIDPKNWNPEKGVAKGLRDEIKSLNQFMDQVKAQLIGYYQEMQLERKVITAAAIKDRFLRADDQEHTLCRAIDYHNSQMKDSLAWGTQKNYYTTQKYLNLFLKNKKGVNDVYLSELSYKFILDFEIFLKTYKPVDHHKPLRNNGIMKHIERFRKIINMAIRLEWIDRDPFSAYHQKFHKVERGFLTKEELKAIENRELNLARLDWVRDIFVFSCYTGLAYIDVVKLTRSNLTTGLDGDSWLKTTRKKNGNPVPVPLLPKALRIIEKYKDHIRAKASGTLFPIISNQQMNSYLKEIADLCGIQKNLTFHLARHTFATTVTLTNGVPIESVSKMLGHSSISTTQIYAKVIEKKLCEYMNALKKKLIMLD